MAVRVTIPRSAGDIDRTFRLRHEVFVTEGRYLPARPDGRIYDRFDALPGTTVMTAEVEGEVVGTVRFTHDFGAGTHVDDYYDFSPHLPDDAKVGSGSMLAVRKHARALPRVTTSLVGMCLFHAKRADLSHLLGTVNPEVLDRFLALGFRVVGTPRMRFNHDSLPFVPVMLEVPAMTQRAGTFVGRQAEWSRGTDLDRVFLSPGERVPEPRPGERYRVIRGTVQVVRHDATVLECRAGDYLDLDHGRVATTVSTAKADLLVVPNRSDSADAREPARSEPVRRPPSSPPKLALA